jgi:membrane-associated phospholipid phosphatase
MRERSDASGNRSWTGPPALTPAGKTVVAVAAVLFLVLLAAVLAHHGRPFALDRSLHDWSVAHRPGPARTAAVVVTDSGVGLVPYVLALVAGVITGRGARDRTLSAVGAMLLLGVVQLLRLGVAVAVGRARPPAADWAVHVTGLAFPSGHTATSATAAGLLVWALRRRLGGWPRTAAVSVLTLWAVAVGMSRIYLGVHWPTDVAGGWLMTVVLLGLAFSVLPRPAGDVLVDDRRLAEDDTAA